MTLVDVTTPRFWILNYTHAVLHSYVMVVNNILIAGLMIKAQGTSLQFKLVILEFRLYYNYYQQPAMAR